MRKYVARGLQTIIDLGTLGVAYGLSFLFRFEFSLDLQTSKLLFFTFPYVILLQYVSLVLSGSTRIAWRYVGIGDARRILIGLLIPIGILALLRASLAALEGHAAFLRVPFGVLAFDLALAFLGIAGVRVIRRALAERAEREARRGHVAGAAKRLLLVGAGSAGNLAAREIAKRPDLGFHLVGFADDDPLKHGSMIEGVRVLGDTEALAKLIERHRVEEVLISMASARKQVIRRIVDECDKLKVPVKIMPGVYELLDGRVTLDRIRSVTIDDLLGRDAVRMDLSSIAAMLCGRTVMITGAGGSIGSELSRQVAQLAPGKVILVDRAEGALFEIHSALLAARVGPQLIPCIADVGDHDRMEGIFKEHRPEVIFHAAAHKHVPMMEWNPGEAVKNNVFGTACVADLADRFGTGCFVLISTDKAVNPTSVMGATKRGAEVYVNSMSLRSATRFIVVRFGNVLGSNGSVIPIFKEQIRNGGPITITHPSMARYFMTIPEACQLVMQAASIGKGGEVFVLDMGEPVLIVDLAQDLIRLSGLERDDIPIVFTGIRPGEKLCEELYLDRERAEKTSHPKIFVGQVDRHTWEAARAAIEHLHEAIGGTAPEIVAALSRMVPELRARDESAKRSDSVVRDTLH